MNNLSWLLYWADVLPRFGDLLVGLSVAFLIYTLFATLLGSIATERFFWPTFGYYVVPAAFLALAVAAMIPSKDTIYMIAASEIGEEAVQTPEFIRLRRLVNNWLDEQLHDENERTDDDS